MKYGIVLILVLFLALFNVESTAGPLAVSDGCITGPSSTFVADTQINTPIIRASKLDDFGRKFVQGWEGLRLYVYDDGVGVKTIGWGNTNYAKSYPFGHRITRQKAERLFKQDINRFEKYVFNRFARPFPQHQFNALTSFAYNLGSIKSGLYYAILENNTKKVMYKLRLYVKAGGKRLRGLVRRRNAEARLYGGLT